MFYLLQTRNRLSVRHPGRNEGERRLEGEAYSEGPLGTNPHSVREGFGIFRVPRIVPVFFGYGFF